MQNQGGRIHYIDVLKGLGMLFVIFAHCNTNIYGNGYLYSFHMALFFLISGLLLNTDKYPKFKDFLVGRLKRLYVPYVVFYLILYVYWLFVERKLRWVQVPPIDCFLGLFWGSDNMHWIYSGAVMWFVISLMILEILFYCVLKFLKSWFVRGFVLIIFTTIGVLLAKEKLYILPFSLNNALIVTPFFAVGYLCRTLLIESSTVYKANKIFILLALIPLLLFTVLKYSWICEIGAQTDISGLRLPKVYYLYTLPFIEIALWLSVSMLIGRNKAIEWVGRNTLPILAFHPPITRTLVYVASLLLEISKSDIKGEWGGSFLLTMATLVGCIPLVYVWNRVYPLIVKFIFR